ncbi:UNKNOWN [Stylonychia lemnae]|uniref:Uncharacterized protein n=1 Tax=Stylonychia lemnae TaxID=5949 RepID=A0A078B859_STYLE|nr:UNKNOWN [Stylonychia lemnae]|eukprot:CDW90589.1 UNKNOWN [Stylonychia lemnae]
MQYEELSDDQFVKHAERLVNFRVDDIENSPLRRFNNDNILMLERIEDIERAVAESPDNKSFKSRSPSMKRKNKSPSQTQLENAFWNCDSNLVVKDMLAVSTKKTNEDLKAFKLKLGGGQIQKDEKDNNDKNEQDEQQLQQQSKVKLQTPKKSDARESASKRTRSLFNQKEKARRTQTRLIEYEEDSDYSPGKSSVNLSSNDENGEFDDFALIQSEFDNVKQEREEQTKLAKLKDLYQNHLHELLIQKQTLEKQVRMERALRMKSDHEIKYLRNKLDVEMKTMKSKIEDEFKLNFNRRQNEMWTKFQVEQSNVAAQYNELRAYQAKKLTLMSKMSRVICWQENDVVALRTQYKQAERQNRMLSNPSKVSLMSQKGGSLISKEEREEAARVQEIEQMHRDEIERYQDHINYQDTEIEHIKQIMERWVTQINALNDQIKELKQLNENLRQQHKNEVAIIIDKYETTIKQLQKQQVSEKGQMSEYRNHVEHELGLKDKLQERLTGYIDVLRKEVITAKRIMANPKLRDNAYNEINFERVYYYDYVPKTREEGMQEKSFDKNSVSIKIKPKTIKDNVVLSGNIINRQGTIGSSMSLKDYENSNPRPATSGDPNKSLKRRRQLFINQNPNDRTTHASTINHPVLSSSAFNMDVESPNVQASKFKLDRTQYDRRFVQTAKNSPRPQRQSNFSNNFNIMSNSKQESTQFDMESVQNNNNPNHNFNVEVQNVMKGWSNNHSVERKPLINTSIGENINISSKINNDGKHHNNVNTSLLNSIEYSLENSTVFRNKDLAQINFGLNMSSTPINQRPSKMRATSTHFQSTQNNNTPKTQQRYQLQQTSVMAKVYFNMDNSVTSN